MSKHLRFLSASFFAGFLAMCAFVAGAHSARGGSEVASFVSPLSETIGGTHQSTYTTGDILYASGANTLSKLAIGSSGNVLNVTGGIPAWASPSGVTGTAIYGDGSNGSITWDGTTTLLGLVPSSSTYTLTQDIYLTSSTVNNGVTIITNSCRIFGNGTLTNNGTIQWNGNNGAAGTAGSGGAGGTAQTSTLLGGGAAGGAGGSGAANGTVGSNSSPVAIGGAGGRAADSGTNTGAAGGTVTGPTGKYTGWRSIPVCVSGSWNDGTLYIAGSGGGGGGGLTALGGGGGGGGGGIVVIAFKTITNTSGTISANGGNGGSGQSSLAGKGAGGGGGVVFYIYNTFTGNTPTATAGVAGTTGTTTNQTAATDGVVVAIANNQ